jgi:acyl transferase domain-containing protein
VFSLEDGLRLIAARGRLMQSLPAGGCMFAVEAAEQRVQAALSDLGERVSIAAVNGPQQTVISGQQAAVLQAVKRLSADGASAQQLTVSHAFHSALMDPILDDFEQACQEVTFCTPTRKIVTNLNGHLDDGQIATAAYWRDQIRRPVRFADGIAELATLGVDVFLEIGPKPVLTALGRQCLEPTEPANELLWLPTLRPGRDDWSQILQTLAQLYLQGAEVDWEGFDQDYARRKLPLPTYPFQRQRYWFTDSLSEDELSARELSARGRRAGRSMQSTTSRAPAAIPMHDAFYEVQWQP